MIEQLIDGDKRGGVLKPLLVALIRYNTEAQAVGNTTVKLRLAAPAACVMDWGDGRTEFIRGSDFVQGAQGLWERDHVYAAPGKYTTILSSFAGSRPHLATGQLFNPNDPFPPTTITPPNLIIRIALFPGARYLGYSAFCRATPYLEEVVMPPGEGIGSVGGSDVRGAFMGSAIPVLPAFDLAGSTTDMSLLCFNATKLTNVSSLVGRTGNIENWRQAFENCYSLRSFPQLDTSSGTYFGATWRNNYSLTSFPLLDLSSAIDLGQAWWGCSGLASFPQVNTSRVRFFGAAWKLCTGLVTFPALDFSSAESIGDWIGILNTQGAWTDCTGLTTFPAVTFPVLRRAANAWIGCNNLANFPANAFNGCPCTEFRNAFRNCALTVTSVNNILISIESSGTSSGILDMNGGINAAPTGAGLTAKNALIARGWVVTTN